MPKKLERCVKSVKKSGGKKINPWAVCNASINKKNQKRKKK